MLPFGIPTLTYDFEDEMYAKAGFAKGIVNAIIIATKKLRRVKR